MSMYELFFGFSPETVAKHPECFKTDNVSPWERTRTTPMQVLSLGMSRTGTASVHAALTHLGYETYHGFRAFADIRDYELWNPAYERKFLAKPSDPEWKVDQEFLDKVLGHVNAVTDMPAISFWHELIVAYPDAKIVLVERDVESWYGSFEKVFIKSYDSWIWPIIAWLDPQRVGHLNTFLRKSVARCQFGATSSEEFRSRARTVYKDHYTDIVRLLEQRGEASTRLLRFNLLDGWGPLCQFLGKEVPKDLPFPNVNEEKMIQEKIQVMLVYGTRKTLYKLLRTMAPIFAAVIVLQWLWRLNMRVEVTNGTARSEAAWGLHKGT